MSRLIIGGQDGSVTFLVVAHNTSLEQLEESKAILRRLPSRKRQKRHYDEDNKETKVELLSSDRVRASGMLEDTVASLVWVPWVPWNPSIFEQWVPEPISFGKNQEYMYPLISAKRAKNWDFFDSFEL